MLIAVQDMRDLRRNFNDRMNLAPIRRGPHWFAAACLYLLMVCISFPPPAHAAPVEPDGAGEILLVAFGDSLTAGLGVSPDKSFASQLETELKTRGHRVRVVNAGVSGDTTAAGLARLEWAIPENADAAIVELGANDALRGLPPRAARANLDAILSRLKEKGVAVLLAGMLAPRNLGPEYANAFDPMYADLAEKHGVLLYRFFLDGVAGEPALNQPDGLHPNARGVAVIVERMLPSVEKLLEQARNGTDR